MSSVKAVIGRQSFYGHEAELHNFDDRWVVVLNTVESGSYVLTGCVTVTNRDSDPQWASGEARPPRLGDTLPRPARGSL